MLLFYRTTGLYLSENYLISNLYSQKKERRKTSRSYENHLLQNTINAKKGWWLNSTEESYIKKKTPDIIRETMKSALQLCVHLLLVFLVQGASKGLRNRRVSKFSYKSRFSSDEKKAILLNNIKHMIGREYHGELLQSRYLAEGDWDFLNDFFAVIGPIEIEVNETFAFSNIDFTISAIQCENFGIGDIVTTGSGTVTQQDLSFFVSGITVECNLDYT